MNTTLQTSAPTAASAPAAAADLAQVYDALALAIDAAGPGHDRLMLTKLCLLLAQALGDAPHALRLIAEAGLDLAPPHRPVAGGAP